MPGARFGTHQIDSEGGVYDASHPLQEVLGGAVWLLPETYHLTICALFLGTGVAYFWDEITGAGMRYGKFRTKQAEPADRTYKFDMSGKVVAEGCTDTRGGLLVVYGLPIMVQTCAWSVDQLKTDLKVHWAHVPEYNMYHTVCTWMVFLYWIRRLAEVLVVHDYSVDMDNKTVQYMSARFAIIAFFLNYYILNTDLPDDSWRK